MRYNRLLNVLILILVQLFCFITCSSPTSHSRQSIPGATSNGYFTVLLPAYGDRIKIDSTFDITWLTLKNNSDTFRVGVSIYNGQKKISTIVSSMRDIGACTYQMPNFGSGAKYRIKVYEYPDTTHYDFSGYFSLYSDFSGTISVTAPVAGARWMIDSTDTIKWSITEFPGPRVSILLYKDTTFVTTITEIPTTMRNYPWPGVYTPLGSANNYHIKVMSQSDASIFGISPSFTIASQYVGSFKITNPIDSLVWTAGFPYQIVWDTIGNPGPMATLQLCEDSTLLSTIITGIANSKNYTWSVPKTMTTGERYRVKIISTRDPGIYALSGKFTIHGVTIDAYEPDNIRESAKTCTLDVSQHRSVTLNDTDWIKFSADSATQYVMLDSGASMFTTDCSIFYGTNATTSFSNSAPSNGIAVWLWTSEKNGIHYARVTSSVKANAGNYIFKIAKFNPTTFISFVAPTQTTIMQTGGANTISWHPDTTLLGYSVSLLLYKGTRLVLPITATSTGNSGNYQWQTPAGIASGNDYQIRIINNRDNALYGSSPVFTINGMRVDAYEIDDTRNLATLQPIGSTQYHTLTYSDTDWVKIVADSAQQYLIINKGDSAFKTTTSIFNAANAPIASWSSVALGAFKSVWTCSQNGTYYLRVNSYASASAGSYNLCIAHYDSLTSISFPSPTAGAVLVAGATTTIIWIPDTNILGSSVALALYKGAILNSALVGRYSAQTGNYSWTLPSTLISGNDYRIKISNADNSALCGYSQRFTINDLAPDSYENDGSRATASVAQLKTMQSHTITYSDTDYVKFAADSGAQYLLHAEGLSGYRILGNIFQNTLTTATTSFSSANNGRSLLVWTCAKSDTYYLRINALSAFTTGNYTFIMQLFDPNQNIAFTNPASGSIWSTDSTYTIIWQPDTVVFGTILSAFICKGSTQLKALGSINNTGSYAAKIPADLFSGSDYRIKFVNYITTQVYGYSPQFSINGVVPDAYEPDNARNQASSNSFGIAQQHNISPNDTDWVRFNADSSTGYIIRAIGAASFRTDAFLYFESDNGYTAMRSANVAGNIGWVWRSLKTGVFNCQIIANTPGSTGVYTFSVALFDSLTSVTFTTPTPTSIYSTGSNLAINWQTDSALLGSTVAVALYKNNHQLISIATSSANSGVCTYLLPSGLPTGSDYSVKIASTANPAAYGLSRNFVINGMTPDQFETDDLKETASSITLGTTQQHTLTLNDTDWVKYPVAIGDKYLYKINSAASFRTRVSLFSATSSGAIDTRTADLKGSLWWIWPATLSGTCYAQIGPYSANSNGSYTFSAVKYDSTTILTITNPSASAVFTAGRTIQVDWVPDTTLFGQTVNIELFKGNYLIKSDKLKPNTGTYAALAIPLNAVPGNDYRVKIIKFPDYSMYAYSPDFTVSGTAPTPDIYEPDNNQSSASTIALTVAQNHSLILDDTDWVQFLVVGGSRYIIQQSGFSQNGITSAVFLGSNQTPLGQFTFSSSTIRKQIAPSTTGTCSIRIYSTQPIGVDTYSLLVRSYDPATLLTFTNPTASSVFSIGANNTISWVTDTSLLGSTVALCIYKENNETFRTFITNNGMYVWNVPGLLSGNDYKIKIVSLNDTALYAFSPTFAIHGLTPDLFEPDNAKNQASTLTLGTLQQHSMTYNDTDWVQFTAETNTQYLLTCINSHGLTVESQIFANTGSSYYNSFYNRLNDTVMNIWTCAQGGIYSIRTITESASDSLYGTYIMNVVKYDSATALSIIAPAPSTTVSVGSTVTIGWSADANIFGNSVSIALYKGNQYAVSVVSSTANDGSYTWTVPGYLENGTNFRLKISNSAQSSVSGFGPNLILAWGIVADSYEPDSSYSLASTIAVGTTQQHTLLSTDKDWIKFAATGGTTYIIETAGDASCLRLYIYLNGISYITSFSDLTRNATNTTTWTCANSGTYYFQLDSDCGYFGIEHTGSYTIKVSQ